MSGGPPFKYDGGSNICHDCRGEEVALLGDVRKIWTMGDPSPPTPHTHTHTVSATSHSLLGGGEGLWSEQTVKLDDKPPWKVKCSP